MVSRESRISRTETTRYRGLAPVRHFGQLLVYRFTGLRKICVQGTTHTNGEADDNVRPKAPRRGIER